MPTNAERRARRIVAAMLLGVGCSATGEKPGSQLSEGSDVVPGIDVGGSAAGAAGAGSEMESTCATQSATVSLLPAVIEFVIDTSGSMNEPPPVVENTADYMLSKWEITERELAEAVRLLPATAAVGAITYPNVPDNSSLCITRQIAVPLGLLGNPNSMQRQRFATALSAVTPAGKTPTHPAYDYAARTLDEALDGNTVQGSPFIVLITDGVPTFPLDCSGTGLSRVDSEPLIEQARELAQGGVRTFVIGSPGSEDGLEDLSRLASAGDTAREDCSDEGPVYCHFDMTAENDLGRALAAALAAISGQVSCEYPLPDAPAGQTLDRDSVSVVFDPSSGSARDVPADDGSGPCTDGWRYSADRNRVLLCPDTCNDVRGDPGGRIDVRFGCVDDPL